MPEILHSFDFSENSAENQRGKYGLIDHVFLGLQQVDDKQGFSMDRYASFVLLMQRNIDVTFLLYLTAFFKACRAIKCLRTVGDACFG